MCACIEGPPHKKEDQYCMGPLNKIYRVFNFAFQLLLSDSFAFLLKRAPP